MAILVQFLLRLSFGLAVGMAVTSSRQVTSGYFRNHLYVTLGLTTLAALAAYGYSHSVAYLATAAAVLSYVGSVCWLYEARKAGTAMLCAVAACALLAALGGHVFDWWNAVATTTSGLLVGVTFASMLLGHWYLNAPGMELAPLRRLLVLMAIAVGVQAAVSATGLAMVLRSGDPVSASWWMFVLLRWSFGLTGIWALVWMAWETLKIPNTQSATGILYVAVIGTFVGELAGLLLSAESAYPL
jgi:hypothetical protein